MLMHACAEGHLVGPPRLALQVEQEQACITAALHRHCLFPWVTFGFNTDVEQAGTAGLSLVLQLSERSQSSKVMLF